MFGEEFFHRLVDAVPSMVWISQADGHATFFNEKWHELIGQTEEQSYGMGWLDVVHPDDRPRLLSSIGPPLAERSDFEIEVRYRMLAGDYRWHMVRALRVAADPKDDQWFGISFDVENLHATEEMFEAQTRAIVATAVDGIITIDSHAIVRFVNPAVERIFGYAAHEVIGNNINMLMPEPYRSRHDDYVANFLRTGTRKIIGIGREVEGLRKDGTTFPMDLAVSELQLADRRMFTGIVRDISDRKRAEAEALEIQQRLSLVLDASQTIIYDCDLLTGEVFWNNRYKEKFGDTDERCLFSWHQRLHPDDYDRVTESIANAILDGEETWGEDYRMRLPDGTYADILDRAHIARDETGKASRISGSLLDVTETKRVRKQLVQAERLAAMGQMLSGIAHESRNALQRIQASSEMLELEIDETTEARKDLERIIRAKEDLNHLFEELRGYAAPIQLDMGLHNLGDAWRQAWAHVETSRAGRDARLDEDIRGTNLEGRLDAFRFEQVFRNLIENSLAACEDPVRIKIRCRQILWNDSPALCVSYKDNGPGLTKEQQLRVFDAFYTTKTKGTGLGMAIARRIVEAHGGTIRSIEGPHGAEFHIMIPTRS